MSKRYKGTPTPPWLSSLIGAFLVLIILIWLVSVILDFLRGYL